MAEDFLYLTTTGRKTGLAREIEIWFVERQGRYYMVAQNRERAHWVRNIQADARVHFSVGTREARGATVAHTAARARLVRPATEPELAREVSRLMDEKYDWSNGLIVELTPESSSA